MELLPGTKIEKFELISLIGVGGMAAVWKAVDRRLNREVAIKFIRTEMFAPAVLDQVLKRFEREAQALARLEHPNIVTVFDFGEFDNQPYLVMNYLPNGTLQQVMGAPVPLVDVVGYLAPVARALAHAHQRGILHRDIKPSNILFNKDGVPQLADFGIARILDADAGQTLTGTGFSVGTPAYMAPEQWRNEVLPQTDQYALGVILFELLTGQKPYEADTPGGFFELQLTRPLPSARGLVPDLPQAVEDLLTTALSRYPEQRFADMAAFVRALEAQPAAAQPKPEVAQPPAVLPPVEPPAPTAQMPAAPAVADDRPTFMQPVTPLPAPFDSGATVTVPTTPPSVEAQTAVQPTPVPAAPPIVDRQPSPPVLHQPPPPEVKPVETTPPAPLPGEVQRAPGAKARVLDPLWQRLLGGVLLGVLAGVIAVWMVGGR